MTVRKNFMFEQEVAEHLEKLAKKAETTQTAIVQALIEEKMQEELNEEKLEIAKRLIGSIKSAPKKYITEEKCVQLVKSEYED